MQVLVVKKSCVKDYHTAISKGDFDASELFKLYCTVKTEYVNLRHISRSSFSNENGFETVNLYMSNGDTIAVFMKKDKYVDLMKEVSDQKLYSVESSDEDMFVWESEGSLDLNIENFFLEEGDFDDEEDEMLK